MKRRVYRPDGRPYTHRFRDRSYLRPNDALVLSTLGKMIGKRMDEPVLVSYDSLRSRTGLTTKIINLALYSLRGSGFVQFGPMERDGSSQAKRYVTMLSDSEIDRQRDDQLKAAETKAIQTAAEAYRAGILQPARGRWRKR